MSSYFTISKNSIFEETEKRSKFISYSFNIKSIEEAKEKLNYIKSKHHSAKHHVYAYSIGQDPLVKFSDDGEPGGTAGFPILSAIQSENLTDVIVIIVRYFGGILLGKPGLRQMYSSGAKNVLAISDKHELVLYSEIIIDSNYKQYNTIIKKINDFNGKIKKTSFEDNIKIDAYIPKSNFQDAFKDISQTLGGDNFITQVSD